MSTPTMTPIRTILISAALALALSACSKSPQPAAPTERGETRGEAKPPSNEHAEEQGGHEEGEGARVVRMDAAALQAAGIRTAEVAQNVPGEQLRAPGEVLDDAYGTTLITPRVVSLVVRRHAKLGDEVAAGTPLVTLTSVEVSDAQAELRVAEQEWKRVSALGREAVAGRRISEAKIALDRARAKAQAYGLPGAAGGGANGQFTLAAPHAGRITEDSFVVGERIEPGRALYRLVDESVVWVDAKLPAGTVARVPVGSSATVVAGGVRISGKVMRAAHRTSEATRNAVVRIEVPNAEDRLHGGDYVEVFLDAEAGQGAQALGVPSSALVQMDGETVVFRRDAEGAFAPAPVRAGEVIGDATVIREGLKAGDTIVVEGAFEMKAQLLKAQLGEGHGH
ncbi:efflux RND transporter periplasmic adaptor subunit [Dokdonella sp.]|uniref:efflux RND transporter periplasmic adaptor subunit n=1 Tax=Dokdonella sp. TaxID=2291710 RepID=UPI001B2421D4|nr:efflux RND transporter periplasmic adaptor subunit [Dokdonella sp.]MBO9663105.1 efflux RND transporter periplasmic adaptor subunit [Dokdonella sp.]